jgi:hypothetical protein
MKLTRPDNAPGYKCKPNRDGTFREGWEARHDIAKRGYEPTWVRLHFPDTPSLQPTADPYRGRCLAGRQTKVSSSRMAMTAR